MPIDRKKMAADGKEVQKFRSGRKQHVLGILARKNDDDEFEAYTQGEIAKELRIRPQHARQILMDFVQKGVCVRKQVETGVRTLVYYALSEEYIAELEA